MNKPYIYYKEQCEYCTNKDKCDYEKRTKKFVETLGCIESVANGVYGTLSFSCDYFEFNAPVYAQTHPAENCGERRNDG